MPNMMVLGDETFGRCLGHESGAFMKGLNVLIRDTTEIPHPFHHVRYNEKSVTGKRAFT